MSEHAPEPLRLGVLGATVGNGHPYSWSAIINGYDRELMERECPFAGIPDYLGLEPASSFGFDDVAVTHVHCEGDGGFTAGHVAACSLIPHVVAKPTDMIGEVDAVLVATDRGEEHVARCRPFVEAGVPVFVDKPLALSTADLDVFRGWVADGARIMSSSSMRYCKEFAPYRASTHDLGELRFVTITSPKSWEAYGMHALEGVYPILGPGFRTVRAVVHGGRTVVHLTHTSGTDVVAAVVSDMYGSFGVLQLCGTTAWAQASSHDSFYAFRAQLADFVSYLRTGERPYPFDETVELTRLVIAGLRSRDQGGREIDLEQFGE